MSFSVSGGYALQKGLFFFEAISVFLSSVFFPPSVCVVVVPERSVFVAVALVSFLENGAYDNLRIFFFTCRLERDLSLKLPTSIVSVVAML